MLSKHYESTEVDRRSNDIDVDEHSRVALQIARIQWRRQIYPFRNAPRNKMHIWLPMTGKFLCANYLKEITSYINEKSQTNSKCTLYFKSSL